MRHELENRIGYIIACFIIVPFLLLMLILKPTGAPPEEKPEE